MLAFSVYKWGLPYKWDARIFYKHYFQAIYQYNKSILLHWVQKISNEHQINIKLENLIFTASDIFF